MIIELTASEVKLVSQVAGIFGFQKSDINNGVEVESVNGCTIVTVDPAFVSDYFGFVLMVAPMFKGVYDYAMNTFNVINTMGDAVDAKWNKTKEVA